jgi:Arc/MetJ-type ribon-helix-helix transcriptional regulator
LPAAAVGEKAIGYISPEKEDNLANEISSQKGFIRERLSVIKAYDSDDDSDYDNSDDLINGALSQLLQSKRKPNSSLERDADITHAKEASKSMKDSDDSIFIEMTSIHIKEKGFHMVEDETENPITHLSMTHNDEIKIESSRQSLDISSGHFSNAVSIASVQTGAQEAIMISPIRLSLSRSRYQEDDSDDEL